MDNVKLPCQPQGEKPFLPHLARSNPSRRDKMPIGLGLWKLGTTPERIHFTALDAEARLEKMLVADISILDPELLGVGMVTETSKPVREFTVLREGVRTALLDLPLRAADMGKNRADDAHSEYVVAIDWIKTRPADQPIWKKGMFANQNSAARLRNKFTLDELVKAFGVEA